MEFKKPNRYGRERPNQNGSQPVDPMISRVRATPRPAPPLRTTGMADSSPPTHVIRPVASEIKEQSSSPRPSVRTAVVAYIKESLKSRKTLISLAIITIGIIGIGVFITDHRMNNNSNETSSSSESLESLEYQTVLPDGKSINQLGGWKRVSPTKSDPVYAFTDTIGDIPISVSEQPLPQSFIGDTDEQVAELAKKFSATNKIDAGGITAYVGTSSKGPQSTIFTKNSLLILIKSDKKIDDAAWIKYIKSLN